MQTCLFQRIPQVNDLAELIIALQKLSCVCLSVCVSVKLVIIVSQVSLLAN